MFPGRQPRAILPSGGQVPYGYVLPMNSSPRPYFPRIPRPYSGQGGTAPKRQKVEYGYYVNHVGYDLEGEPVYQQLEDEYQQEDETEELLDESSSYPL